MNAGVKRNPFKVALDWIGGLIAVLFIFIMVQGALGTPPSEPSAATQSEPADLENEAPPTDSGLDESHAGLKRSKADLAYAYLMTERYLSTDSVEEYNARVTELYNNWVAAERDAEGPGWHDAWLARANQKRDCSELYGPFMHEDAQLRQLRVACAVVKEADKYAPARTLPTLEDFLMPVEAAPAEVVEAPQASTDSDYVAAMSYGQ